MRASAVLAFLALAGLAAPLVALAVGGLSSRYAADDYCTAGQAQMAGFIEAQSRLYVGWSGRFAATLLITLVEWLGPSAVPFLPGLALLAWLAAATWAAQESARALGWQLPLLPSAVLGTLVVFATLQTTADLPQVLFWQTGMLTYLLPLVLATAHVGWLAHVGHAQTVRWPIALSVSFALAFVAGGTSETFAAAQVTALVCAAVIAYLAGAQQSRRLPAMLVIGLLGAVLALAVIALAPGNSVRQETAEPTPLALAVPRALEFTQGWLRLTFARPHAAVLLLLIGIAAGIAAATTGAAASSSPPRPDEMPARSGPAYAEMSTSPLRTPRMAGRSLHPWAVHTISRRAVSAWLVGVAAAALVIFACMLPAYYALSSNPPGRAQVIPQYVLICAVAALGWVLGTIGAARVSAIVSRPMAGWVAVAALLVLLALGPLLTLRDVVQQAEPARAYAASWDQLDRQVRAERTQGVLDVTVRPLPSTGLVHNLDFIGPDRHDWFNECVARYYDLNTIASTLSVP